jgi:hydrogenase maturation factor
VDGDSLPIFPETRALCEVFGLDPLGVIASGALLLAVAPGDVDAVLDAVRAEGIPISAIGHAVAPERGLSLRSQAGEQALPRFDQDEIARLFG